MKLYLDENISPYLARGLNKIQTPENSKVQKAKKIEVASIKDDFGEGEKDEVWIPKVGKEEGVVITQDINIKRTKHQNELCKKYGLGMIYLKPPKKGGFSHFEFFQLLAKHWPQLVKVVRTKRRPFAFRITSRSGKLEELDP